MTTVGNAVTNGRRGGGVNGGDFEKVAPLEEFTEVVPASVQLSSGEEVCLVRLGEEVFAIAEECPHSEFPMSDGAMVDDYVIECGMHGCQFDIRDGSVIEPPANEPIQTYAVKIVKGEVWVRTEPT